MTLYARSDIRYFNNPACPNGPHRAKDGERLVIDCPHCEPIARRAKALYSEDKLAVPRSPEEVRLEEVREREARERRNRLRERLLAEQERRLAAADLSRLSDDDLAALNGFGDEPDPAA